MRSHSVLPAGAWPEADQRDTVLVDFDRRHRRRIVLTTESGASLLVDLPHAARLRDGDALALESGGYVRVRARPEHLLEIHSDQENLIRIAWHLGNRHLPVQMTPGSLIIRYDHVIADMVHTLGGHAHEIHAAFDPEAGAYAGGHSHLTDDDDDHHHDHAHPHGHDHDH